MPRVTRQLRLLANVEARLELLRFRRLRQSVEGGHPLDRDFALVNAKLAPLVRHGPPPD
jgi:hypothetical protein